MLDHFKYSVRLSLPSLYCLPFIIYARVPTSASSDMVGEGVKGNDNLP